jgi:hypothetical protein
MRKLPAPWLLDHAIDQFSLWERLNERELIREGRDDFTLMDVQTKGVAHKRGHYADEARACAVKDDDRVALAQAQNTQPMMGFPAGQEQRSTFALLR